jgi:hypothetical protein
MRSASPQPPLGTSALIGESGSGTGHGGEMSGPVRFQAANNRGGPEVSAATFPPKQTGFQGLRAVGVCGD